MEKNLKFLSFCCCLLGALLTINPAYAATSYGRCVTPMRQHGSCVQLEDCSQLYQLIQSPNLSNNDREFLRASQCGYYSGKVLICCLDRYVDAYQPIQQPEIGRPSTQRSSTERSNTQRSNTQRSNTQRSNTDGGKLPSPPNCGFFIKNKIFGGNITQIDEFPWLAMVEYTKPGRVKDFHCGGTLINKRYVLTAAHCVNGQGIPSSWYLSGVRLGEWDLESNPDCETDVRGNSDCAPPHIDVSVEEMIPHPDYDPGSRNNLHDIALLRLSNSVTLSDFVQPICLSQAGELDTRSGTYEGTSMDIAGWGQTEQGAASTVKLKATVTVRNLDECRRTYAAKNVLLEPSQMCAGGVEGVDSCRGDSGGPLMVEQIVRNRATFFLVGVVSFGPTSCGLRNWPGVYTKVDRYMDWIRNTIRD